MRTLLAISLVCFLGTMGAPRLAAALGWRGSMMAAGRPARPIRRFLPPAVAYLPMCGR